MVDLMSGCTLRRQDAGINLLVSNATSDLRQRNGNFIDPFDKLTPSHLRIVLCRRSGTNLPPPPALGRF